MAAGVVSPREQEVLGLLGDHLTHEQIARRLVISVRTVESHVAALRRKLDLPDHRSLVKFAVARQRSADADPAPLPGALTSFVGRTAELTALEIAQRDARLVTAIGPGGVGKTRLVLAAVERLGRPVYWVDLVPVADPGTVEDAVAQACGVVASSRLGPLAAVAAALRGQRAMLVLDNAEHLVNAVAVVVERLLTDCADLAISVTSRLRLALPFERVFRVDGLSDEAVTLFLDRARAAGAPVDGADRARLAALCRELGGLPLAIELAAGRLPTVGLTGLEEGLLTKLSGGPRASARHRSMADTLDWSVALLDEATARALPRLAVPVAGFGPDVAVAVAAFEPLTDGQVRAALPLLVEHNLLGVVWSDDRPRYRLLEPIRQYALTRLTEDDQTVFVRHLDWCRAAVARVRRGPDPAAIRAVADDARAALTRAAAVDNRQAAVAAELASDLGLALFADGSLREAQARLEQAAKLHGAVGGAAPLAHAAAVARCRVSGEEALRLDLAAAERAEQAGQRTEAALALARAVETVNRFAGMFATAPTAPVADLLARARTLAPDSVRVRAALAVATLSYGSRTSVPVTEGAREAYRLACAAGDEVLQSAALDGLTADLLFAGDTVGAYREAAARVALFSVPQDDPAHALEFKDALHMAVYAALGAGHLTAAHDYAVRQQRLHCLRERRDLADDEVIAPAALAGDWGTVRTAAATFLADWTAAGSPAAVGRALAPAAVGLAHGLRGADAERERWLAVLARIRGVDRDAAWRDSGYGDFFEAMVLLHRGQPRDALTILQSAGVRVGFGAAFHQWVAACAAEAAVLAREPGASALLDAASSVTVGNPVAELIVRRAGALGGGDPADFDAIADALDAAGAGYQAQRTRDLSRYARP